MCSCLHRRRRRCRAARQFAEVGDLALRSIDLFQQPSYVVVFVRDEVDYGDGDELAQRILRM